MTNLTIIGGGLAGCEAAWQAACSGVRVTLFEMRPFVSTGVHKTGNLAELVCSNSLGSNLSTSPAGLLKSELRLLNSLILQCAEENALPAGRAIAVDRDGFSKTVEERLQSHPNIEIVRQEITRIPDTPTIIATGPLTSEKLTAAIRLELGEDFVFFFDALAPIVTIESIEMSLAFRGSRYEQDETADGDYINCPLTETEYEIFLSNLLQAEVAALDPVDASVREGVKAGGSPFFEACLPIEVLAARNPKALTFGPLRPVGLRDPRDNSHPYAVLQLRQDDLANTLYNVVGFQTNLKFSEQQRVLRLIPALANAEFARFGQMHRNTYVSSPKILQPTLQTAARPDLFFAGQIAGIEGYTGNIASGLLAGMNAAQQIHGQELLTFPIDTMIGALHHYVANADPRQFQPMKAIFGLLPPLEHRRQTKQEKGRAYAKRSLRSLRQYISEKHLEGHQE